MHVKHTIARSLIIIVMMIVGFAATVHTASAYNIEDKAIDRVYVEKRMPELKGFSTQATANLTALKEKLNLIQYAKYKIFNSSTATTQQKADANTALESAKIEVGEAAKAQNLVLSFVKQGTELYNSLKEADNTNTTNCYTSLGAGQTTDSVTGEPMHICARVFLDDYFLPAREELGFTVKSIDPQYAVVSGIMNNLGLSLTQEDQTNALNQAKKETPISAMESCFTIKGGLVPGVCIREGLGWFLYVVIVVLAGILKLAGLLLDQSIQYSVIDVTKNIDSIGSINSLWLVIRDLANLCFIFLLLYVAIGTILQTAAIEWRKILVRIIISAILINFSLFITKVIIDLSNIIALSFYNRIGGSGDLSIRFMDMLGIVSIYDVADQVQSWAQSWASFLGMAFGATTVMFIAAFSFLAAAWMFIIRYVIIIILLVVSPLAFVGFVIPQTSNITKRWREALIGQALFPIIYMIMIWITVEIGSRSFLVQNGTLTSAFAAGVEQNTSPAVTDSLIRFIVLIVLLNSALILAVKQANRAGGRASDAFNWGLKRVEKMRYGTQGYIGRGAVRTTQLNRLDKYVAGSRIGNYRLTKAIRENTTGKAMNAKFGSSYSVSAVDKEVKDLKKVRAGIGRQVEAENKITLGLTKAPGSAEHTEMLRTISQMSDKQIEELDKDVLTNDSVAQNLSSRQIEAIEKSEKISDSAKDKIKAKRYAPVTTGMATIAAKKADPAATPADIDAARTAARPAARAVSDKELELLDPKMFEDEEFIGLLSSGQLDSVLKSTKFTAAQKQKIRDVRTEPLRRAAGMVGGVPADPGAIRGILTRLGNTEVSKLSGATLKNDNVIDNLTQKMLEKIADEVSDPDVLHKIGTRIRGNDDHQAHGYVSAGLGQYIFV